MSNATTVSPWINNRTSGGGRSSASFTALKNGTDKTINVVIGESVNVGAERVLELAETQAAGLLRKGLILVHLDGTTKTWRRRDIVTDHTDGLKESQRYTYDDAGRVLCQWVEVTMSGDGTRTERKLRKVWITDETAFGY